MKESVAMKAIIGETSKFISPLRLLACLLIALFFAEAIIMFTLPLFFHSQVDLVENFADSVLLVLIITPFLWFLIVRPLRNNAEEIKRLNVGLAARAADLEDANRDLEQAKLDAEAANLVKSDFLANISHEMRTPLTGVMGVIDMLLIDARTDEDRHYLEMAKMSANSLKGLINDSIDFARYATGEMSSRMRPFNLRSCVRDAADVFVMEVNRKGLRYLEEIDDGVPEIVRGDAGRLRQVLVNLIGNAVKFTEHGEIGVSVRPASDPARPRQDILLFAVRDTGCGIAADYLENIFEKFTQADASSTKKYGGSGLGLALARQIVENMGGNIRVESRYGEGSIFSFTIPFIRENAVSRRDAENAKENQM